jgi:hypothetical protein
MHASWHPTLYVLTSPSDPDLIKILRRSMPRPLLHAPGLSAIVFDVGRPPPIALFSLFFVASMLGAAMGAKAMKPWFGPLIGSNVGYQGLWARYNVMPVSWQGCLVTLAYFALQLAAAIGVGIVFSTKSWVGAWVIAQVLGLHLVYLWIASRHYVTRAQMEHSVRPADVRDPKLN